MPKRTPFKSYIITAKVEIEVDVFARNPKEAVREFEARLLDDVERAQIFNDAWSLVDSVKVRTADKHLGPAE
jgi:hypothetical protein